MTISRSRIRNVVMSLEEKKFFNAALFAGTDSTVAWQFASAIAGLQQGTSATTRLGNSIHIHAIHFMIHVDTIPSGVTVNGSFCRMLLYHNREAVGAVPTGANLFDADNGQALRNVTLMPRFKVLRDAVHNMSILAVDSAGTRVAAGPPMMVLWSIYPKKRVDFQSNAGTISDVFKDDYGIGFSGSQASCCNFTVNSKLVFTDA